MEGNDPSEMPSTQNRIRYPSLVQVLLAFSNRKGVIKAVCPALAAIEVGKPLLRSEVVAVLRPRRIAADFWLVVDALAEGVGAQEIEAVRGPLLCLELKGMVSGVPAIHD